MARRPNNPYVPPNLPPPPPAAADNMMAFDAIWDLARQIANRREMTSKPEERTVIVLGSKSVGKTRLIYHLLERSETPKPTLALEYSFGRKANRSLSKDTCHIWELGGGTIFSGLLQQLLLAPLQYEPIAKPVAVVLMLDLSSPTTLWKTLESLIGAVTIATKDFQKNHSELYTAMTGVLKERMRRNNPDVDSMDPLPMPLIIIGGKYDIFKDMDPENKKVICRSLRSVAFVHGASLHFYADKDAALVKRGKDVLSYVGFGTSFPNTIAQDYNAPLAIPAGMDTLEKIGLSPGSKPSAILERAKQLYIDRFPQEADQLGMPDDPAQNPSFKEPAIDSLRAQKDDELDRLNKEIEYRLRISRRVDPDL